MAPVPAAHAEYRGKLEIRHTDDFAHGRTHTSYGLLRHGRRIPLSLSSAPRVPSGSRVIVRGRRLGSRIRGTVRPRGILHAASVPIGPRKTAVILINFASDTSTPWTPDQVRQRVFTAPDSVSAFYSEESYGDVSLIGDTHTDGDVYGWYTITPAAAGCNTSDWAGKAKVAASAQGFLPANYQHVIYAFPYQASCGGWAGLGELPGRQSWINGSLTTRVMAHELGHNMGLHHASSLTCTSGGTTVAYSSNCNPDDYGDPFDVMGSGMRHNNAWHLRQIGFMGSSNVTTVSSSGTYTLTSAIARGTAGQTQLLRVPITGTSPQRYYDLEVRSSGGVFDNFLSTSPAVKGVTIHVDRDVSVITQSLLIDATPGSPSGFSDAPLPAGATFTDGTVSIAVSAVGAGTATVDVLTGPQPPDTGAPSVPGPLAATPGQDRVTLSWPAATDNVGVTGYRVYRDDALKATVSSPGWVDYAVSAGASYAYRVAAFDAAGNVTSSAPVTAVVPAPPATSTDPAPAPPANPPASTPPPEDPILTVDPPLPPADTIRPFVRILSPASRARVRRRSWLRASAADAAGVVRTEVWVDRKLRKSASGSLVRWRMRQLRRGRHLVVVRAYDAAGNHGRASVRVRIIR
jgi:hypothetical protein